MALSTIAAVAAALAVALPTLLSFTLARLLPEGEVASLSLRLGHLEIRGLRAAAGRITAERVLIEYDWRLLMAGRIDRVVIEGLGIKVDFDGSDIPDFPTSSAPSGARILPEIGTLQVADGVLHARIGGADTMVRFAADGDRRNGIFAANLRLAGDAQADILLSFAGNEIRMQAADGLRVALAKVPAAAPEAIRTALPGRLQITVTGGGGGPLDWSVARHGESLAARGDLRVALTSRSGLLTAEASFTGASDHTTSTLILDGGRLRMEQLDWSIEAIRARADFGSAPALFVDGALLRHHVDRPWVRPLLLSGSLIPSEEGWNVAAELADPEKAMRLRLIGQHRTRDGTGSAHVVLDPLRLSPDGTKLSSLFPILAGHVRNASGRLAANGRITWNPRGHTQSLSLLLEDMAATIGAVGIHRLNTVIEISGVAPVSTPPDQILAVGLIQAGLPLTDGRLVFEIHDNVLHIRRGTIALAGGRMEVGETVFAAGNVARQQMTFDVDDADLSEVVRLVGLDGLEASGRLAGRIPVALVGDRILVDGGQLAADRPGMLRYRPAERPAALQGGGQPVDLMLKALDNFRYKALTVTLTGEAGGEMEAALHIEGNNPDLYEGYPLEFNLNLRGKLDRILHDTLAGYQIPDKIRQRMLEFPSP